MTLICYHPRFDNTTLRAGAAAGVFSRFQKRRRARWRRVRWRLVRRLSGTKYRQRSASCSGTIQSVLGEIFCCFRAEVDGMGTRTQRVELTIVGRPDGDRDTARARRVARVCLLALNSSGKSSFSFTRWQKQIPHEFCLLVK